MAKRILLRTLQSLVSMYIALFLIATVLYMTACGYNNAYKDIHDLQSRMDQVQTELANMQGELDAMYVQVQAADESADISALQAQITGQQAAITQLQLNVQILGFVDPCGDGPGFDEILIRTSAGLVAYFESGSRRHLSVLTDGHYVTTDQQSCAFTVLNGQVQ